MRDPGSRCCRDPGMEDVLERGARSGICENAPAHRGAVEIAGTEQHVIAQRRRDRTERRRAACGDFVGENVGVDDIKGITKDNEWFTERILVKDQTVTIWLNDKEVVKWTQPGEWNGGREGSGRVLSHGTIALQGHDPGSTVYYKNIRIKPLP